ncbi:MAG: hypothetical protein ACRDGA_01020, partial [Bacteroidota bacterium]
MKVVTHFDGAFAAQGFLMLESLQRQSGLSFHDIYVMGLDVKTQKLIAHAGYNRLNVNQAAQVTFCGRYKQFQEIIATKTYK